MRQIRFQVDATVCSRDSSSAPVTMKNRGTAPREMLS